MIESKNHLKEYINIYKKIKLLSKQFNNKLNQISNHYISKSETEQIKNEYKDCCLYINNNIIIKIIYNKFLIKYKNIEKIIDEYNVKFIEKEKEKHKSLFDNICGYPLDDNQRNAVITDDDKNLIVAGAGSGKSLTMIGKIHYLIKVKNIKESEILCISFTNETTKSLKNKLKKIYNYDIDVYTFHKLGYQIIKTKLNNIRVAPTNILNRSIDSYFNNLEKEEIINILKYFSEFTKIPKNYKIKEKHITLKAIIENKDEYVRDKEEVELANFLYLKGISYTHEKTSYGCIFHICDKKIYYYNFYNPQYNLKIINKYNEFNIYKYHFLINEVTNIVEKIIIDNNIKSFPLDYKKIYIDMKQNNNDYISSLKKLIMDFMNIYKSSTKSIDELKNNTNKNTIEYRFLYLFEKIYNCYQDSLKRNNEIDINDMLLLATSIIEKEYHYKQYKYILIDEFQDTSFVRYQLIHNIIKHTKAKLVAVGDDFQSIYRFSGCDINLFINFEKYFGQAKIMHIENTYRNSQELIDIAGTFIMKNPTQIKKKLYSNKHQKSPIEICYYDDLSTELLKIIKKLSTGKDKLIVGRNNKDIDLIKHDDINVKKDYIYLKKTQEKIPYLTVHKSKGLEYDYIFLINMSDNITGFPSKITETSILKMVLPKEEKYMYAEERRLFYVALTRAKEKVFILTPKKNPSIFVKELEVLLSTGKN